MNTIVLTGGGTAGHVTPNLALAEELRRRGFDLLYIGSYEGIEKELAEKAGLPYRGVSTGKLRRYFDLKNLTDPIRVQKGVGEARRLLRKERPALVFSKGGFVSVPVVVAARELRIPVIIHESDMTPGLANRICYPYAAKILCNFPETLARLPKGKSLVSGCPIRPELLTGSREAGLAFTGLSGEKPVLLAMGGSLGSVRLNNALRSILPRLLKDFEVVHLCGRGNTDPSFDQDGYRQYEYISGELKDLFALADLVISRAGANAVCELIALRKPNLLIPLSAQASRGDQILNAASCRKQGFSMVLQEEEITDNALFAALSELYRERDHYAKVMAESPQGDAVAFIADLIEDTARKEKKK